MKIKKFKPIYFYLFISILILLVASVQIYLHNYYNMVICFIAVGLLFVFKYIIKKFRLELPFCLEVICCLFVFSSQVLGEVCCFYEIVPSWDNFLHFITGFIMSSIGISFLYMVFNKEIKPHFVVLCFAFCFSMTISIFWEFGEYFLDNYFGRDCQKDTILEKISSVDFNSSSNKPIDIDNISETHIYSNNGNHLTIIYGGYLDLGIHDTMRDLFVNLFGCLIYIIFSYFDYKRGNHFYNKYFRIIRER